LRELTEPLAGRRAGASGLATLTGTKEASVDIGHIRTGSAGKGRIKSCGSGSSPSRRS
jgi:hypothetical protein